MVVPKINTNVKANIVLTATNEFATGAMIGEASWGDLSKVFTFSNYQEVVDTFKSGNLVEGARYFFNNGGKTLKQARITPSSSVAVKASYTLTSGATDVITLSGKFAGTYGNKISVTVLDNSGNRDVIISDGSVEETFTNLSSNTDIVSAITAGSELVTAALDAATPLVDVLSQTFLTLGNDGTSVNQDYIDELNASMALEAFDYLSIPGKTENAFHASIQSIMNTREDTENFFNIYITGVDKFEDIATTIARTASNSRGRLIIAHTAIYKGEGSLDDTANWDDGSYTGCAYNGIICSLPINTSPTNKEVPFTGAKSLTEQFYTSSEKASLADAGFTLFDRISGGAYGTLIAVTRNGDESAWQYLVDSRRKVDFILDGSVDVGKSFIGDPNDDFTRRSIKSGVASVLVGTRNDRIITDYQVEALQGTDPRAVDVNITVKLIFEVDFINISLTLNI